ncbi:MAG: hypothetical protein SGARI_003346 [Bacillariaceae sp.]
MLVPALQIVSPFLGIFVDKFGPKIAAYCQAVLAFVGLCLIVLATSMPGTLDFLLFVGFIILAIQTWMGRQLIVQFGLYFNGHTKSRVIYILSVFFDLGSLTYLMLLFIQRGTDASTSTILGIYLGAAIFLYSCASYFWTIAVPSSEGKNGKQHDKKCTCDCNVEPTAAMCLLDMYDDETDTADEEETSDEGDVELMAAPRSDAAAKTPAPTKYDLKSAQFMLLCAFFAMQAAFANWNLSTQNIFLTSLGDAEHDNLYLIIFTLLTPVAILGAPLIDYIVLKFGWAVAFQTINILSIAYMTIKVVSDSLNVQVIGFVIFSFYRSFFYGTSFSILPTLLENTIVGRGAGVMTGFAGIASLLLIPLANSNDLFLPNLSNKGDNDGASVKEGNSSETDEKPQE